MPEYVNLRGHQIYNYEWDSGNTDNEALLLLHGGLSQTSHWDYAIVPELEDDFHIYAYDRTGHGYTGDQAGSFHFEFQTNTWSLFSRLFISIFKYFKKFFINIFSHSYFRTILLFLSEFTRALKRSLLQQNIVNQKIYNLLSLLLCNKKQYHIYLIFSS